MHISTPVALIAFRFLLAPAILVTAYTLEDMARIPIIVMMYLGLISDILDGIIARRQDLSTARLRRMDSQTDMIFWLSIGITTWMLHPSLIRENRIAIWAILLMEITCYVISLIRFKKETCTHAFLSKLWGITLLIAFTSLIGFNHAGWPFFLAIFMGLISHIDRILITLILPYWTHDVPSTYHAYLIRKGQDIKRNKWLNG